MAQGSRCKRPAKSPCLPPLPSRKIVPTIFIVDTMQKLSEIPRYAVRRTKRSYSAALKAELIAACQAPGASIAAVASTHGMNANVLYRWLKQRGHAAQSQVCIDAGADLPSFIPVSLPMSRPEPVEREIKVEVRKGGLVMTITWPMSAASDFAQWSTAILQ